MRLPQELPRAVSGNPFVAFGGRRHPAQRFDVQFIPHRKYQTDLRLRAEIKADFRRGLITARGIQLSLSEFQTRRRLIEDSRFVWA